MRRFLSLIAILCGLGMSAPAMAEVNLKKLDIKPNPRLGLSFPGSKTKYYSGISDVGIGVVRISASWGRIQPTPDSFDFSGLDSRVAALQELGIEPFLTFESNADWATKPETQQVKNAQPKDLNQWAAFVTAVVERYDGDGRNDMPGLRRAVPYWQAANEWISDTNRSGGWVGTSEELVAYVSTAYNAVKKAHPKAIFSMGGIAAFNADALLVGVRGQDLFIRQQWNSKGRETILTREEIEGPELRAILNDRVLPTLKNAPYDYASVHLYGLEERDADRIDLVGDLSGGRPVLSSECGGPTLDYGGTYSGPAHFRAVIDRNMETLVSGARFCLWFRLGEAKGATYGNSKTALYNRYLRNKPGTHAYRLLSLLLTPDAKISRDGARPFAYKISYDSGKTVSMRWLEDGETVAAGSEPILCHYSLGSMYKLTSDPTQCIAGGLVVTGAILDQIISG